MSASNKSTLPRPATRIRPRVRHRRCFELAFRIQMDDPTWTLVHGYYYGWMEHAWLRRDGVVYDAVQNKSYTVEQYEKEFSAREVAAYDLNEACLIAKRGVYDYFPERPKTFRSPELLARIEQARAQRGRL